MISFVETDSALILQLLLEMVRNETGEDLAHGDERRIFTENLAQVVDLLYNDLNLAANAKMLRYAQGEVLDVLGERLDVPRIAAEPAATALVFTLSAAQTGNVFIPQGTRVTPDGVIFFATDDAITIRPGDTQGASTATSQGAGEAYNGLGVGSISTIVDPVAFVQSVENVTETSGGNDEEDDEHYRDRIQKAPGKLAACGPEESYIYWALTADADIMDVSILSPAPTEVLITVLMNGGQIPSQGVLDKVLEVCNGRERRPLTDLVTVQAAKEVSFDIDAVYYTTAATETEVVRAVEGSGGAIDQFIEWQRSAMGRDVNPDKLNQLLMSAGCIRTDINLPADTVIDGESVAIFSGNLTVDHHIAEW